MRKARTTVIILTLRRFRTAVLQLARSDYGPQAMVLSGGLLLLMLAINGLNVFNSYVGRDFMSAVQDLDSERFKRMTLLYVLVFAGSTLAAVYFRFIEERLGLVWREQLTRRLMGSYMDRRTYYRLDSATGVANPDQRLTEDVRAFTTTTLSFTLLLINGSITALSFSGVLWSISPVLFLVAVGYACCGTLLTVLLGKPLVMLNYKQLDLEANFRADLIHVRENSESIALAHREGRFKLLLHKHLSALLHNYRRIISINRTLGFFTTGYNYLIQLIPLVIIAPLFIRGKVEFGVITQSAMAFATLAGAFSLIVTQFQSISAFTAVTARLFGLNDAIETVHKMPPDSVRCTESPDEIRFRDLTLYSSDRLRVLLQSLNLTIQQGERWVVLCPEDLPKVALFRASAGLWDNSTGGLCRPGLEEILFLPERPYLPPGSLREVLLRTGMESIVGEDEIRGVLAKLEIEGIIDRVGGLDTSQDWDDLLSIGEQHLFSMARILLAKPGFVLLDRPGSSLPKTQIATLLDMFTERGIGCLVFAKNGESRLAYHGYLEIHHDGSWTVRKQGVLGTEPEHADISC